MDASDRVRELAERYRTSGADEQCAFLRTVASDGSCELTGQWLAEIRSRAADIDSGQVELVDGEEFMQVFNAI